MLSTALALVGYAEAAEYASVPVDYANLRALPERVVPFATPATQRGKTKLKALGACKLDEPIYVRNEFEGADRSVKTWLSLPLEFTDPQWNCVLNVLGKPKRTEPPTFGSMAFTRYDKTSSETIKGDEAGFHGWQYISQEVLSPAAYDAAKASDAATEAAYKAWFNPPYRDFSMVRRTFNDGVTDFAWGAELAVVASEEGTEGETTTMLSFVVGELEGNVLVDRAVMPVENANVLHFDGGQLAHLAGQFSDGSQVNVDEVLCAGNKTGLDKVVRTPADSSQPLTYLGFYNYVNDEALKEAEQNNAGPVTLETAKAFCDANSLE